MSLQVSNQGSTGRRTPLAYQSFGGNVAGAPGAATTGSGGQTPANGAGSGNAPANAAGSGGGGGGRTAKGGAAGKQSQIPVAVGGGTGSLGDAGVGSPAPAMVLPPTAVVHPGSAGNSTPAPSPAQQLPTNMITLVFPNQKHQLLQQQQQLAFDHQYGSLKQQQALDTAVSVAGGRKATNGSSSNGAGGGGSTVVEKNGAASKASNDKPGTTGGPVVTAEGAAGKVRDSPRSSGRTQQKQPSVDEPQKTPEKPTKEKQLSGGNKTPQKTATAAESSLLVEKPLKGFDAAGDEMESLILEPWELDEELPLVVSPPTTQGAGSAKSKLPKPGPTAHARVAPYKSSGGKQGGTTDEQKATVPEQKAPTPTVLEAGTDDAPGTPTSNVEASIGRPLRSISGRRSTRPISDIKFTHHRQSGDLNESISSLNVTVGSDIYMDTSMRTPGSATRKRKDLTPTLSTGAATSEVTDSPKRARLDFSGLFGIVASPVTMLKSRLSSMKLRASTSTPRSLALEEADASKVVTAEATSSAVAADPSAGTMEVDEKDVTVATEAKEEAKKEGDTEAATPAGTEDNPNCATTATTTSDATTLLPSAASEEQEEVEVKIVTEKPKQWCSVM